VSPLPKTGCAAMSDPFTSLSAPSGASSSSCDADSKKVESNGELNPGVYCNGLEIKGGVTVSLKEGVYVIKNGQFRIGSSAIVTGSNVLIYMSGSNSTFDWGSSSRVQLKGRADGSQKGVVFWSASANTANHKFGCDNTSYLEGVVYSPSTGVEIGSNGTVNGTADWTAWVVKRLQMGSSSGLSIQTKFSAGATPMPDAVANGGLQYLLASGTTTNNQPYLVR
jgi:acetyltransferase-like isoleucine patch superfamily enzyme